MSSKPACAGYTPVVWLRTMAECFRVTGGVELAGRVRPAGNKNAALPMIAATLAASGPSEIANVPRIRDVEALLALVASLGADVEWIEEHTVRIDPSGARAGPLDPELCSHIRASILLAGPLLARFGSVTLPPPGGAHRRAGDRARRAGGVGVRRGVEAPGGPGGRSGFVDQISYAFFDRPTGFLVRIGELGEDPVHFRLTLDGASWRVTALYN